MTVSTEEASGVVLRFPVRVGWEISSEGRGFGLGLGVRPWLDVVFPSENPVGTRYGVVFELTLTGYSTRASSP